MNQDDLTKRKIHFQYGKVLVRLLAVSARKQLLLAMALNLPYLAHAKIEPSISPDYRQVTPNPESAQNTGEVSQAGLTQEQILRLENRIEWHQLISEDFRGLATRSSPAFQEGRLDGLSEWYDWAYYSTLGSHIGSLENFYRENGYSFGGYPRLLVGYPNRNEYSSTHLEVTSAPSGTQAPFNEENQSPFVEAFDRYQTSVAPVETQALSLEYSQEGQFERGWNLAIAPNYWPTLYWKDTQYQKLSQPASSGLTFEPVPLVNINTLATIEFKRWIESSQQAGAGIIFGEIAADWQIEISPGDVIGQSVPLFLDTQGNLLKSDETHLARHFIILNVNPGSRILYLNHKNGSGSGGVTFPVLPGTSTYLNLKSISTEGVMTGILFDETSDSNHEIWPLSGSTVRIIGQPSAIAVTDEEGRFSISHVLTAGNLPIYSESYKAVESESGQLRYMGFTHRYRVMPSEMQNLNFYRVSKREIRSWINQMPNGLSKESGLIVGAFTDITEKEENLKLVPTLKALPTSPNFEPFALPLNGKGYLVGSQDSPFILKDQNRFLGAQIPEGPAVIGLIDSSLGRPVYQELLFITPQVIHMVGPYSIKEKLVP